MIQLLIIDLFLCIVVPFQGSFPGEAVAFEEETPDCIECHGDLVERMVLHEPAGDACENCHESTGANHPSGDSLGFRLMDRIPALCFYCHEEGNTQAHGHRPVEEGNCLACHEAHGSSLPSLLIKEDKELCLDCHEAIARLVRGSHRVVHTAITDLGCTTCHQAHGSEYRALLVDAYPAENYLPASSENFGLCFLCHDAGILEEEETDWATGFRNGNQNLHWIHINGNKGRNCRMCHNIHGSPLSYLVEERVGFGNWEMNLNFVPEEQGGSCLPGCHGKLSYHR